MSNEGVDKCTPNQTPGEPRRSPGVAHVRRCGMVLFHVPDLDHPACADPVFLPLVDEAYRRPGGPAADVMRERLCRTCPAAQQCFSEAMERGEWGAWAGTSLHARTRAGGAKPKIGRMVA